jgi:hypothetical protein
MNNPFANTSRLGHILHREIMVTVLGDALYRCAHYLFFPLGCDIVLGHTEFAPFYPLISVRC